MMDLYIGLAESDGSTMETLSIVCVNCHRAGSLATIHWCLWCNSAICCGDKIGELLCGKCKIEDSRMYKHGREIAIRREAAAMRAILGKAGE